MLISLLFAAQAAAQASSPPDIALDIRADVREVRIRQRGEVSLEMRAGPDGGTNVDVDKPEARGAARLRNVRVHVSAEARIADPGQNPASAETPSPQ